jgi:hypothetical protein
VVHDSAVAGDPTRWDVATGDRRSVLRCAVSVHDLLGSVGVMLVDQSTVGSGSQFRDPARTGTLLDLATVR